MAIVVSIVSKFNDKELKRAIRSVGDFQKVAAIAGGGFAGNMQVAGGALKSVGDQAAATGASLSRNLTLPIAAVGAYAVKSAADFETSMAQVQVAAGVSATELEKLSDYALQMGADTIFSAGEASDAMLELAKSGMSSAEIQGGALKSTLDLAAASGMELADAAVVAGAGMNTFGLSAQDSSRIVDALAGAANASAADVSDLAMSLQQVGQQAVASGMSLEETTGALAAFADAGIRGSDAGTSLKVFLQRLVPASKESAKAMDALGMDFFDAQGNMLSMAEIAGVLEKSFAGLTQEQRLAEMQTIFGSDATRAANILYTEGAEGIAKYIKASQDQGAAAEMAGARMSGMNGALEQLKGSVETAAIKIGQQLEPIIISISTTITNLTNKFTGLSDEQQQLIVKIAALVAAAGPMLFIFGKFLSVFGSATAFIGRFALAVKTAGGFLPFLQGGFTALLGPIGLIVAAIAGAIAVLVLMWKNSETFRNAVTSAFNAVKDAIANAVNRVKASLDSNKDAINGLKAVFKFFGDYIGTVFVPIIKFVLVAAINIVGFALDTLLDGISFVMRAFGTLKDAISGVISWFGKLGTAIGRVFTGGFSKLADIGKNIVEGIWRGISGAGGWLMDQIKGFAANVVNGIKGFFGIASPAKVMIPIGKYITDGMAKGITGSKSVATAMNKLAKEVVDGANDALQKFKDKAQAVLDFAKSTAANVRGSAGLGSLLGDPEKPVTTDSLRGYIANKVAMFKEFAKKVEELRKSGLPNSFLQDVINAGPEGGLQLANAILGGGASFIKELQGMDASLDKSSAQIGASAAQSEFGMSVGQAKGIMNTSVKVEAGAIVLNVGAGTSAADAAAMRTAVTAAVQAGLKDLANEYNKRKKK